MEQGGLELSDLPAVCLECSLPDDECRQNGDGMTKIREFWNKPEHIAYLFIAPALLLLLVFSILPLVASLVISTFDANMTLSNVKFIGLGNFTEAFHDSRFWNSMWVTVKWTLVEMPVQVLVALFLAALIVKNTMFNKICRGVYFLPIICSATAVAIMWRMILHSNVGYIPFLLRQLGFGKVSFMNNPGVTFYVIVFMSVWKFYHYSRGGHAECSPGTLRGSGTGSRWEVQAVYCHYSAGYRPFPLVCGDDAGDRIPAGIRHCIYHDGRRPQFLDGDTGNLCIHQSL